MTIGRTSRKQVKIKPLRNEPKNYKSIGIEPKNYKSIGIPKPPTRKRRIGSISTDSPSVDSLSPESKEYAQYSNLSYQSTKKRKTGNLRYDAKLSNNHVAVYVDDVDKKVVTAFRGTIIIDGGDLIADAAIAVGAFNKSHRFREMDAHFQKILDAYGDYKHIVTGHSLGGSTALAIHDKYKGKIYESHAFNPGIGLDFGINHDSQEPNSNKHAYFIHGDPISNAGVNSGNFSAQVFSKKEGSAHSINQFI